MTNLTDTDYEDIDYDTGIETNIEPAQEPLAKPIRDLILNALENIAEDLENGKMRVKETRALLDALQTTYPNETAFAYFQGVLSDSLIELECDPSLPRGEEKPPRVDWYVQDAIQKELLDISEQRHKQEGYKLTTEQEARIQAIVDEHSYDETFAEWVNYAFNFYNAGDAPDLVFVPSQR